MCACLHSETQRELEERTHEVLDMDNALKERQGELQQRAQLVQHAHKQTNSFSIFNLICRVCFAAISLLIFVLWFFFPRRRRRRRQLCQLDVAIREHKQEMELKAESLQQSLEARERELKDAQRELTGRNMKVRSTRRIRGQNV